MLCCLQSLTERKVRSAIVKSNSESCYVEMAPKQSRREGRGVKSRMISQTMRHDLEATGKY